MLNLSLQVLAAEQLTNIGTSTNSEISLSLGSTIDYLGNFIYYLGNLIGYLAIPGFITVIKVREEKVLIEQEYIAYLRSPVLISPTQSS